MGKNTVVINLIMLVVGIGVGYTFGGDRGPVAGTHTMPGGSMMGNNIDQHFIVQMIPHHEGAIAMAKVALERSKRPEIRSLAEGIIEAQEREINDMKSWYQDWYGTTPPSEGFSMGGMHMSGMEGDVDELATAADANFDREFIVQMIPHHEMAIVMAGMLQASTERAEMTQLADNIIASQSREIEMMQSWLTSWYGE